MKVVLTDWKLSDLGSPLSDLAFLLFSSADQATRLEQRQQLVFCFEMMILGIDMMTLGMLMVTIVIITDYEGRL